MKKKNMSKQKTRYTGDMFQHQFSSKWKHVKRKLKKMKKGYLSTRDWQDRCFGKMKDKTRRIINTPPGSGKTLSLCHLSTSDMLENPDLKVIKIVPQTIIAGGFRCLGIKVPEKLAGKLEHDWTIDNTNDLLSKNGKITEKSMVERAIAFLEEEDTLPGLGYLHTRVLLCSHQTAVALVKKLKKSKRLDLLKDTSWVIDESHHGKNKLYEDAEDENDIDQNELGKLIKTIYDRKDTILTLATATFFRGDRLSILTPEMEKDFERFNLPFDEHYESLKYLRSFSFDFMFYEIDPIEAIRELFKIRVGKTIIHLAHTGSRCSSGDKYQEVRDIIDCIKDPGSGMTEDENGVYHVTRRGKEITILDLVDDTSTSKRDIRKKYIQSKAKEKDGPDVVITMDIFKEGGDYIFLDRSIIIGPRNSLNQMVQTPGRLLRDAEGKKHIEIIQLFPRPLVFEGEIFKDKLNDYVKGILTSMMLEDILKPIVIFKMLSGRKRISDMDDIRSNAFNDLMIDEQVRVDILSQVLYKCFKHFDEHGSNNIRENFNCIVDEVLEDYGLKPDIEISNVIYSMFEHRTKMIDLSVIDVSHIDVKIMKYADNPIGKMLILISDACKGATFKNIRKYLGDIKTPDEWLRIAEKMVQENGGILPCGGWLRKNGYSGLYRAIRNYPDKFSHIKQKKYEQEPNKTPEEWVKIAEKLVKKNNGLLPCDSWLRKYGYGQINEAMKNHPGKFSHIIKENKSGRTPDEWIPVAEKIVKENNGFLPSQKWLREHDYGSLPYMMRTYPEKFSHIKQKKMTKTPEEWVPIAEKLAKENDGILPKSLWLQKNNYSGLATIMQKHPDKFAHIEQDYGGGKTVDEWVPIAEKLVKENNGILPNSCQLEKRGYNGINNAMKKHPDKFSHIEQEYKGGKTVDEWVPIAEKLAKEHNGILPSPGWLGKHGYASLCAMMRNHSEKFFHIKQDSRKGRTVDEWVPVVEKIVKENNGFLPGSKWLKEYNYSSLYYMIRTYPDKFAHIKMKKKKRKTSKEWVPVAEKLAKDNNGILPCSNWLTKNHYFGLDKAIRKHTELFSHIKQEKLLKTPDEWVTVVEKIAKKNNGLLPNQAWLLKNNYYGLCQIMYKYPEKFSHIKQKKLKKTLKEWVEIAEELAKDNNGILPCSKWLCINGYTGLRLMLSRYPKKFFHIKQNKLVKIVDEWVIIAEKLAKNNNNILPNYAWLRKHGYEGVSRSKSKYPEKFIHIKKQKKRETRTVDEWVSIAEKLVEEHGGLPAFAWLKKHNLRQLHRTIKGYPDKFKHIERKTNASA
jgi:hypothetical protein